MKRGKLRQRLSRKDEAHAIRVLRERNLDPHAQAALLVSSRLERLAHALRKSP